MKPEIVIAAIAAIGAVAVALVGIIPLLMDDPEEKNASQIVTATGNGNVSVGVQGGEGHTITLNSTDPRLADLLDKGLPQTDHPVINLSEPIEDQLQLFAGDKVQVWASNKHLFEVWFGSHWEPYISDREYLVWGTPGTPITPKFRGQGYFKIEVSFTKYRDKPRDLRRSRE